ncbi:receptor-type protein kinase, putative [Bodo saltans]|uniref:Receptor-type protein kinase, putative n=1 Tax=Bodo saltans TaxID=75058 RepID=A0A0S4KKI4_BODSA|nr:receptor-type protein kinase, putative [Bodo saltans]|eukprot:CUI15111.1 receptor-type protein kinase, putative [Bodo saltans]
MTGCLLSAVSTLTHLDLTLCTNVNNTGLMSISKLSQLQHLKLLGCKGFDDVGLRRIAALPKLSTLSLPKKNILDAIKFRDDVKVSR